MSKNKKKHQNPGPISAPSLYKPPPWQIAVCWAVLIWSVVVYLRFEDQYGTRSGDAISQLISDLAAATPSSLIHVLPSHLKSLFYFVLMGGGILGWGLKLLPGSVKEKISWQEKSVLGYGVGILLISTVITLMGVSVGYSPEKLTIFTFLFGITGIALSQLELRSLWNSVKSVRWANWFSTPSFLLVVLLSFIAFVMAFVPEVFYDSLVYHLGIPQLYLNEGTITDTPYMFTSRFPMLIQMIYVACIGVDGSTLAKLINWSVFMTGLLTLWAICRRAGWGKGGVWACLLIVGMPLVQLNIWSTAVDCALGSVGALAILTALMWKQSGYSFRPFMALMGLFAGACLAVKYTGALMVIAVGATMFWGRVPGQSYLKNLIINTILFGIFSISTPLPFLVRNYAWEGNPVYPMFTKVLGGKHVHERKYEGENGVIKRYKPKNVKELILFPWTQTFRDMSSFNFIGPMTLATLPILLLCAWRKSSDLWFLSAITVLYFLAGLSFSGDIRYLLAGFFALACVLAAGLAQTFELGLVNGGAARTGLFLLALYHLGWIINSMQFSYTPGKVLNGLETREKYSATMHNGLNLWPWNTAMATLQDLPDSSRVYILGTEQVFGFPKKFFYCGVPDHNPLVLWSNDSPTPADLLKKFEEKGLTHLLIDAPETMRLESYQWFEWTEQGRNTFVQFANAHLELLDVKPSGPVPNAIFVFAVKPDANPSRLPFEFGTLFKEVLKLEAK